MAIAEGPQVHSTVLYGSLPRPKDSISLLRRLDVRWKVRVLLLSAPSALCGIAGEWPEEQAGRCNGLDPVLGINSLGLRKLD